MKASEIKKLKDFGHYRCDKHIFNFNDWIREFKQNYGLNLMPDFQRGRVWTKRQSSKYVEFLLRGGKTSPLLFNQSGWMTDFKGEFVCVDGLQRICSLVDFLDNKLPVFGDYLKEDIEGIDRHLRSITITYWVNTLETKAEVLEWYLEMNTGATPHTKDELDRVQALLNKEKAEMYYSEAWFDDCFKAVNPPSKLRELSKKIIQEFDIRGCCDPGYIANVVGMCFGLGDGCGTWYSKRVPFEGIPLVNFPSSPFSREKLIEENLGDVEGICPEIEDIATRFIVGKLSFAYSHFRTDESKAKLFKILDEFRCSLED